MLKKNIRKEYLQRRQSLTNDQLQLNDKQMLRLFEKIKLPQIQQVLSYYPVPEKKEFDVKPILELLAFQNSSIQIAWPKIDIATNTFNAYNENPAYGFVKNQFQIPEPYNGVFVDPESFDLVLVPLLITNFQGFRVGYGKGYYDRYLSLCRPNVIKLGFSYFEPIAEISDIHHFDVPLSYCITPTKLYEF